MTEPTKPNQDKPTLTLGTGRPGDIDRAAGNSTPGDIDRQPAKVIQFTPKKDA